MAAFVQPGLIALDLQRGLIASDKRVFATDFWRIWLVLSVCRVVFDIGIHAGKFVAGARIFNLCLHGKLEKLWYLVVEEYDFASMIIMLGRLDGR